MSSTNISIFAVFWAILVSTHVANMENTIILVKASEQEVNCVRQTGWWSGDIHNNTTKSPCSWFGITCNDAGSVTEIEYLGYEVGERTFPKWNLSCFSNLVRLELRGLGLSGSIPQEIGRLSKLRHLDLSSNGLTGELPPSLVNLSQLVVLDLSGNQIGGPIPQELGSLKSLGTVSQALLDKFPYSFGENKDLNLSHGSRFILMVILPISIFVALFFTAVVLYRVWLKNKIGPLNKKETKIGDLFSMWNFDGEIAYEDIRNATEDFDIRYCIGVGGHGIVYRAQLADGKLVALKKLHSSETKEPALCKEFCK
ncbi:hypothetical protein TIFTF001_002036 [Ficus carica]|uniref:non-specific serine/threonine protein kinase n=1 Tax=Ficus carica TaxID=3494 RepID=A0AA88CSW9_FICCA|nr:hypothetical protein TIFTF001_002036 [Ficus carica]